MRNTQPFRILLRHYPILAAFLFFLGSLAPAGRTSPSPRRHDRAAGAANVNAARPPQVPTPTAAPSSGQSTNTAANSPAAPSSNGLPANSTLLQTLPPLPLFFEANRGQVDSRVRFLARSSSYTLFLTPQETVFAQSRIRASGDKHSVFDSSETDFSPEAILRMKLKGANLTPLVTGEGELPGKVNYLIGNDASKWHTGVPLYSEVRSKQVYPGIDLLFHGDERQLEYDFVVSPGADPRNVVFDITGAEKIELDPHGNLVLHTSQTEFRMLKPAIYQPVGTERRPVEGRFKLNGSGEVSFQIAAYDHSQPLVIDPAISFATFLGGAGKEEPASIDLDTSTPGAPKLYVSGFTSDLTTFAEAKTTLGTAPGAAAYVFIAKIDPTLTGASSLPDLPRRKRCLHWRRGSVRNLWWVNDSGQESRCRKHTACNCRDNKLQRLSGDLRWSNHWG